MVNLIAGFGILLNHYFFTGLAIATMLLISSMVIMIYDDEDLDFEDHISLALYFCIGYILVTLCWILIPIFAPFALCCTLVYVGKKILYIKVGMYNRRRRNFIKDNFIYRHFVDNDRRQGEDVF